MPLIETLILRESYSASDMMLGVKSPPIMPCQHRLCGCLSWSPRWFCDACLAETTCPSKHGIVQYCAVQDMPWSMRPQTCCRWRRATTRLIAGLHLRVAPQPIADRWGRLDHRPPFFFLALFRVIRTLQGPFEGEWPLWSMAASAAVVVNGGGGGGSSGMERIRDVGPLPWAGLPGSLTLALRRLRSSTELGPWNRPLINPKQRWSSAAARRGEARPLRHQGMRGTKTCGWARGALGLRSKAGPPRATFNGRRRRSADICACPSWALAVPVGARNGPIRYAITLFLISLSRAAGPRGRGVKGGKGVPPRSFPDSRPALEPWRWQTGSRASRQHGSFCLRALPASASSCCSFQVCLLSPALPPHQSHQSDEQSRASAGSYAHASLGRPRATILDPRSSNRPLTLITAGSSPHRGQQQSAHVATTHRAARPIRKGSPPLAPCPRRFLKAVSRCEPDNQSSSRRRLTHQLQAAGVWVWAAVHRRAALRPMRLDPVVDKMSQFECIPSIDGDNARPRELRASAPPPFPFASVRGVHGFVSRGHDEVASAAPGPVPIPSRKCSPCSSRAASPIQPSLGSGPFDSRIYLSDVA